MKFYTLLYLDEQNNSTVNGRSKSYHEQVLAYIGCIRLLKNSLLLEAIELEVLTNNKQFIISLIDEPFVEITELSFSLPVPVGIKFYAAHFKLEVFNFLSKHEDQYVGLIDSDVVCINEIPDCFLNCIREEIPLYYDISEQVFAAYGQDKILAGKRRISLTNILGIWAGGEFIAGPPSFFRQLDNEITSLRDAYFAQLQDLHHQGDEFLTSVALENCIIRREIILQDAGQLNIIGRYWNFPPKHNQRSFDDFFSCFLLHLPSNKKDLARIGNQNLAGRALRNELRKTLLFNMPINYLKKAFQTFFNFLLIF